jgi:hypothetical protein
MRISIFLVLLAICLSFGLGAYSQEVSKQVKGMIILRDGDTLQAMFNYDLPNNLVQVSMGETIKAYGARQIEQFNFFDSEINATRYFFSLPFNEYSDYKVPTLFELLYNGQALSLLAREVLSIVKVPAYDAFTQRTYYTAQQRLVSDLYFRNAKGIITHYLGRKKQLYAAMRDFEEPIKNFIKAGNLSLSEKMDVVKIVEQYNKLAPQGNPKPDEN